MSYEMQAECLTCMNHISRLVCPIVYTHGLTDLCIFALQDHGITLFSSYFHYPPRPRQMMIRESQIRIFDLFYYNVFLPHLNTYNNIDIHFKMYYLFTFTFYTRKIYNKGNFPNSSILRELYLQKHKSPRQGVILRSSIEVIITQ